MKKQITMFLMIPFLSLLLVACNDNRAPEIVEENEEIPMEENKSEAENNTEESEEEINDNEIIEKEPTPAEEELVELPEIALQKNDEGEDVQIVQEVLTEIGYELDISGTFDDKTVWALTDFQLKMDDLYVTGMYDPNIKTVLEQVLEEEITIEPGSALAYKEETAIDEETVQIGNPYEVLALVNKQHALPSDYIPENLVVPDVRYPFVEDLPKKQMRKVAADALEEMFAAADEEGLGLFAQSGYRSYDTQDYLFSSYVTTYGEQEANTFSARPGESEHQTGLTMDVTSPNVNYSLVIEFGETEEGIWLKENAAQYGFIIRYPEGKEEITEYQYEPWHIRYVGKRAAKEIMEQEITLEEYLGVHEK